jgi:hypothetical protein
MKYIQIQQNGNNLKVNSTRIGYFAFQLSSVVEDSDSVAESLSIVGTYIYIHWLHGSFHTAEF